MSRAVTMADYIYVGPDYRNMGPFVACPVCNHGQAWIVAAVDESSLELAWYGLDALCFSCYTRYKLACPADSLLLELPASDATEPPAEEPGASV